MSQRDLEFPEKAKGKMLYCIVLIFGVLSVAGCASTDELSFDPRGEFSEGIVKNDSLVMDVIFDECLSYIKDGDEPFSSFLTLPPSSEAVSYFDKLSPEEDTLMHLFSTRYSVIWGGNSCSLTTMVESSKPSLLGVDRSEFLEDVEAEAIENGLTEGGLRDFEYDNDFSPLKTIAWHEPEISGERSTTLILMVAPGTPMEPQGGLVEIGVVHLTDRALP